MSIDENVGIHILVVLVMTGRFHGSFVVANAAMRTLAGRMVLMTLLMAKFGSQTDSDANHEDRGRDATGDAQDRTQIRRFHYDCN